MSSGYFLLPVTPENVAKADASLLYGEHRYAIAECSRERGKRCAQRLYYDETGMPYVWGRCRWRKRYVVAVRGFQVDGRVLATSHGLVLDGGSFAHLEVE